VIVCLLLLHVGAFAFAAVRSRPITLSSAIPYVLLVGLLYYVVSFVFWTMSTPVLGYLGVAMSSFSTGMMTAKVTQDKSAKLICLLW